MDTSDIDEIKDVKGFGVAKGGWGVIINRLERRVEALVKGTGVGQAGLKLGAGFERGGCFDLCGAGIVAFDPDGIGGVVVDALEGHILVAVEWGCRVGAIVEGLSCNLSIEANQGRVEALEERSSCVEEDALVRCRGVNLRGDVVELGDAEDAMRRSGGNVPGAVVTSDLEVLRGSETGQCLGAIVFGGSVSVSGEDHNTVDSLSGCCPSQKQEGGCRRPKHFVSLRVELRVKVNS